jgi:hypothetical protein
LGLYSVGYGRSAQTYRSEFGARLHAIRQRADLSQRQMAKLLGLTQRAYFLWERYSMALAPRPVAPIGCDFSGIGGRTV